MQCSLPGNVLWHPFSAMLRRSILLYVLFGSTWICGAYGQTIQGVVWDESTPPTIDDLLEMHEAGIQAIRLPILEDDALLYVAETLGLQLFQDLPMKLLPSGVLLKKLEDAKELLDRARQMNKRFPSVQRFGVSTKSDTSTPDACEYFKELSEWAPELKLYYVSAFVSQDQCFAHVDLVLLDTPSASDSEKVLENWQHATPIGLARFGKQVISEEEGLYQANSPESQARFLEDHLPRLLGSSLEVVFVYRWRDSASSLFQWGLIDKGGEKRPAYEVVRGIYTGTEDQFAFEWGEPPRQGMLWPLGVRTLQSSWDAPWPLILAWISVLLVVLLNLWYHRFPSVMRDYIMNRYPHRETLYRESAILGSISFVYVIAQVLLITGVVLILLEAYWNSQMIAVAIELLNSNVRGLIFDLVSKYSLLVVATAYLVWSLMFSVFGAWTAKQPLEIFFVNNAMNQTFLWIMLPFLMVAPGLDPKWFQMLAHILGITWVCLSIYCTIRSARNFSALSRSRVLKGSPTVFYLIPALFLLMVVLVVSFFFMREYIVFWWHLSFRA